MLRSQKMFKIEWKWDELDLLALTVVFGDGATHFDHFKFSSTNFAQISCGENRISQGIDAHNRTCDVPSKVGTRG